jgi:hypothetical protein
MIFMLDRVNEISVWNSAEFLTDKRPDKPPHVLLESMFLKQDDIAPQTYYVDILGHGSATLANSIAMIDGVLMILGV